jgi:hypothetical protein
MAESRALYEEATLAEGNSEARWSAPMPQPNDLSRSLVARQATDGMRPSRVRFAKDSLLERAGFEPSVPRSPVSSLARPAAPACEGVGAVQRDFFCSACHSIEPGGRSALSDRTNADHRTSRSISARTRGAFDIAEWAHPASGSDGS